MIGKAPVKKQEIDDAFTQPQVPTEHRRIFAAPEPSEPDTRDLLADNNDELESLASVGPLQTGASSKGRVLTTPQDSVKLGQYVGSKLEAAKVRYPKDARTAFDDYGGCLVAHFEKNLKQAKL